MTTRTDNEPVKILVGFERGDGEVENESMWATTCEFRAWRAHEDVL